MLQYNNGMEGREMSQQIARTNKIGVSISRLRLAFLRCRKGVVAAEFALILPMLSAMMFGTLEYGMLLYSYSAMQTSARDMVRQIAVNTISVANARIQAKERVPVWMRQNLTVNVAQSTPATPATNVFTMTLSVPASKSTPITFFTKAGDFTLSTQVQMKQELPYAELPK